MARVNVYLPDDLAEAVREADLNVSGIAQEALVRALDVRATDRWLDAVERLPAARASHEEVLVALRATRDEFGQPPDG